MERPPPLAAELVNEFVLKAHSDLNRVKELLAKEPKLVNACWDWGGGIFAVAMLGHLDVVKTAITADPRAAKAPGPHGIPLLTHAKMGGEKAAPVLEYLQSLG